MGSISCLRAHHRYVHVTFDKLLSSEQVDQYELPTIDLCVTVPAGSRSDNHPSGVCGGCAQRERADRNVAIY
jgi:hypothetical protein